MDEADPEALFKRGNLLLAAGDADAAVSAFQLSLQLKPDHAATYFNLGNAQNAAGRRVDAADAFLACLRLSADFAPAYINLASTLRLLALLDHAQAMADAAVRLLPYDPEALICLASVLHDKADYASAIRLYRLALDRMPDHAGALTSLGNSLLATGQVGAALAAQNRAVARAPSDPECRFNRAAAHLSAGDFATGWADYEWRWRRAGARGHGFGPTWRGEDIAGRTILLHAEQGLGDTLQFVRYVPLVAARGARVVLRVQPPLVRLMQGLSGVAAVVADGDRLPPFDTHCPLLSLPFAFGTRVETIPADVPYLRVGRIGDWVNRLPSKGLKIGLVWAGLPRDQRRGRASDRSPPVAVAGGSEASGRPERRASGQPAEGPARGGLAGEAGFDRPDADGT
jgi:Flp pilus assembly protein TadD